MEEDFDPASYYQRKVMKNTKLVKSIIENQQRRARGNKGVNVISVSANHLEHSLCPVRFIESSHIHRFYPDDSVEREAEKRASECDMKNEMVLFVGYDHGDGTHNISINSYLVDVTTGVATEKHFKRDLSVRFADEIQNNNA